MNEIEDLTDEIQTLRDALSFYADVKNYTRGVPSCPIDTDAGDIARKTLGGTWLLNEGNG